MSWHYLQGQAAASWAESCSDGAPSALLSLIPTRDPSSSLDSGTGTCTGSRSGMTCAPSTAFRGADMSTSSLAGSHARTSAQPERARGSKAPSLDCGARWLELSVRYDRASSSWRTHLCLFDEVLPQYLVTLPSWGMMLDGVCWERDTSGLHIRETGSGSWLATPTATANQLSPAMQKWAGCRQWLKTFGRIGGYPKPSEYAWLMGWPIGWTDLEPLETDRFRQWLRSHGAF